MSRFSELETFVRVVEAGSITGAADRMEIAKSAVSRRLSALEERLGVQLLNRTTRKLSLTDSGRSLYDRSVRLLDDLEEAELNVSQSHCELAGRLRVAVPLSFGLRHLAPAVDEFSRRHPEVEFDLDLNDRQVDLLEEGFDLGIRIARLEDSSFIARRLATTRHIVCASPLYLERFGRPQTTADLLEHRCLVYGNSPSPGTWSYEAPDGEQRRVEVRVGMRASNGDFLEVLARAGHGVIMEPDFIVHGAIERGELEPLLEEYRWLQLGIYALYPSTRFLSRRVRDFVDFLTERFAGVPYWA